MNIHRKSIFYFLVLVVFTALFGCSTYQNVVSYFNTYYNAQKLFNDAVIDLNKTPRTDIDTNYFILPASQGGAQSKFDQVIAKCSKLIQYYPNSNLVDDAILLIGKSGVYLGETELAIRKFDELFQNFPESELRYEARLWYAKALYFSNKQDEALKYLDELFPEAVKEGENDIAIEGQMLAAQIYFKKGDNPAVIKYLESAVNNSGDDNLLGVAHYQLAFAYDRAAEYEKAADAYKRVLDFTNDRTLQYKCKLRRGVMLYHAEKSDAALALFQDLNSDVLKPDDQAMVDHEVANVYASLGDSAKAFDLYQYVDTTYKRTDAAARSYFQAGLLMENVYGNFRKAKDYYEKAKAEFQASAIVPSAAKRSEYIGKYFSARNTIKASDSLYTSMLVSDSLKMVAKEKAKSKGGKSDSTTTDSTHAAPHAPSLAGDSLGTGPASKDSSGTNIAALEKGTRSLEDVQKDDANNEGKVSQPAEEGKGEEIVQPGESGKNPEPKPDEEVTKAEEAPAATEVIKENERKEGEVREQPGEAQNEEEAAGEEAKPMESEHVPESGSQGEQEEQQERKSAEEFAVQPVHPAPRNIGEARAQRTDFSGDDEPEYGMRQPADQPSGDGERALAVSGGKKVPGDAAKQGSINDSLKSGKSPVNPAAPVQSKELTFDSLDNLRARGYFELGMVFLLEMNRQDSAEIMLNKVVTDFPGTNYMARSLYTLAELYRMNDDTCAMDSLYRIIHAYYSTTDYGKKLKPYFGEPEDTAKSIDSLEMKYAAINVFPDSAHALESINQLQILADQYPTKAIAAKAQYAIGWIYENVVVNNDSAAAVYKKLVQSFPSSEYSAVAKPKVAVKENPESLSQYVQVKEIQAIAKPTKKDEKKKDAKAGEGEDGSGDENQGQPGNTIRDRFKDRNAEENPEDENVDPENTDEEPTPDEEESPEPTDPETPDDGGNTEEPETPPDMFF